MPLLRRHTRWTLPFSTPADPAKPHGNLLKVFMPCSEHGETDVPDRIVIPESEHRYPELNRDYVREKDVCLAGNCATNGRCGAR